MPHLFQLFSVAITKCLWPGNLYRIKVFFFWLIVLEGAWQFQDWVAKSSKCLILCHYFSFNDVRMKWDKCSQSTHHSAWLKYILKTVNFYYCGSQIRVFDSDKIVLRLGALVHPVGYDKYLSESVRAWKSTLEQTWGLTTLTTYANVSKRRAKVISSTSCARETVYIHFGSLLPSFLISLS